MKSKLSNWGNSLAVRLPRSILNALNLKKDDKVIIKQHNNQIIITPAKKTYNLADMIKNIDSDNIHTEIETGDSVGNELW